MKNLKPYLNQYKAPKILDIGSGKGDFIKLIDFIYQDYSEIIGIDIVDYLMEMNIKAIENNPKVRWMEMDVLETTFPKNSFDIISLSNTLHHIKDISTIFDQMTELLKPDGMIIVSELMNSQNLSEKQISHQLLHSLAAKINHEVGIVHSQVFSKQSILDSIEMFPQLRIIDYWELETKQFEEVFTLEQVHKIIDGLVLQVKESAKYDLYVKEAQAIKEYLDVNGFSLATQLCVIVKKASS